MESYVVSRKLAEKLKAAGYPQKSEFTWYLDGDDTPALNWTNQSRIVGGVYHTDKCAAPLSDELLEQVNVANEIAIGYNDSGCFWHFQFGERGSGNMMEGFGTKFASLEQERLVDALAELWLWAKEQGYIK